MTHLKCGQRLPLTQLPTRLIDVRGAHPLHVHLHEVDSSTPKSPYTTLSHCWGDLDIMQLRKDNLAQMIEEIEVSQLPKTFQDAITITRRLEIPFLWIDSLCIIQDSKDDWARESSMMATVYQNSYCNIAATAAPDGSTGCFMERNPFLAQPCRVSVLTSYSDAWLKSGAYEIAPLDLWWRYMDQAPLNLRGWVVQERLLAPRVIHFGKHQIFWECHELVRSVLYKRTRLCQQLGTYVQLNGHRLLARHTRLDYPLLFLKMADSADH
jgi:hypothetical protein